MVIQLMMTYIIRWELGCILRFHLLHFQIDSCDEYEQVLEMTENLHKIEKAIDQGCSVENFTLKLSLYSRDRIFEELCVFQA